MTCFCRLSVFLIALSCSIPNVASAQGVNMPDASLAAAVRIELGLAPNARITRQALQKLTYLYGRRNGSRLDSLDIHGVRVKMRKLFEERGPIKDLTGLEHATNLDSLLLDGHVIKDIGPLKGLTQLRRLLLGRNQISDITPLAGLTQLRELTLFENQISDVTPLAGLTQLRLLYFWDNEISDVTPLAGLTQLELLFLWDNEISDVTPLAGLTQLRSLPLMDNQISDVTPLAGLTQLWLLDLDNNEIRDVTPIQHLIDSARTTVSLEGNPIGEQPAEEADLVIESVGEADLVIESVKATHAISAEEKRVKVIRLEDLEPKRHIAPEEWFDLHVTIRNKGTEKSTGTQLIVYRSVNEDISEGDIAESRVHIFPLIQHRVVTRTLRVLAPKTVGTYYYGACIADNKCSTQPAKLTVTRQPELRISSIKVGTKDARLGEMEKSLTVAPGEPFDFLINILNEGEKPSDETTVRFYLSTDAKISKDDWLIKTSIEIEEKVEPGKSLEKRQRWWALDTSGTYYYYACVDPIASERNPDNNCSAPVEIIVIDPCDRPKVHVIWYYPKDEGIRGRETLIPRWFGSNYIAPANLDANLKDVQDFFQREVNSTFDFNLDSNGKIKLDKIQSTLSTIIPHDSEPATLFGEIWQDIIKQNSNIRSSYNTSNDIYLVLVQSEYGSLSKKINNSGAPGMADAIGGRIAMASVGPFGKSWNNEKVKLVIAHELGHNFGLFHDFAVEGHLMSYNWEEAGGTITILGVEWGTEHDKLRSNRLSARSKNWLKVHPAFNNYSSCEVDTPIEIKVNNQSTPLTSYGHFRPDNPPVNRIFVSDSNGEYKIHLDITDSEGIHHVELIAPALDHYKACLTSVCSPESLSLARYLYANSSDPGVSGSFSQGGTKWSGTFDITEWMAQKEENCFDAYIATIDKTGTSLGFSLKICKVPAAPAPFAQKQLPKETALLVNYPNPFNPETWIPYQLAEPADVTLTIYDIQGRVVRDLDLGHQRAGMYHTRSRAAYWDGRNVQDESVASGIYFYTLKAGDFTATRKLLIRK